LVLILVGPSTFAELGVQLEVHPSSILPGTASNMKVTILNDGTISEEVRDLVVLEVTAPDGTVFFAGDDSASDLPAELRVPRVFTGLSGRNLIENISIQGGEDLSFELSVAGDGTFFNDRRLSFPGHYRLRLGVLKGEGQKIFSNEVVLEVRNPDDVDRDVWFRMLELSDGRGWALSDWRTKNFGDVVWDNFRESSYLPFSVRPQQASREDWPERREVGLTGPFRDLILLEEARSHYTAFMDAIDESDHVGAKRAIDEAKAVFESVLSTSQDEYLLAVARSEYGALPSQKRINEIIRSLDKADAERGSAGKVAPLVSCVEKGSEATWTAWFGYESPLEYDLWLGTQTGENKFNPKPFERGQPENFEPGRHDKVFSVTFDGNPITWFVRGEKATASKTSRACN
jgi:hypothetical protein